MRNNLNARLRSRRWPFGQWCRKAAVVFSLIFIFLVLVSYSCAGTEGDPLDELLKTLGPLGVILAFVKAMGLPGAIIIIWYVDRRDSQAILKKYKEDMDESREMYRSNVRLVEETQEISKNYCNLASDLKDIIVMNTQAAMLLQAELKGRKSGRKRA